MVKRINKKIQILTQLPSQESKPVGSLRINLYFVHHNKRIDQEMMLYKLIPPSVVTATIQLPASKSISNRALIINALGKGIYPPENLSDCDDTQVMIKSSHRRERDD